MFSVCLLVCLLATSDKTTDWILRDLSLDKEVAIISEFCGRIFTAGLLWDRDYSSKFADNSKSC